MNSFRFSLLIVLAVFVLGCLPSTQAIIPVEGATAADWHPQSFWYHPWGRSGTHKGIDIFARSGNAQGKAPHLHFAIRSLLPIWQQYRADAPQAWNLLFYLDPSQEFRA
ncbi:hypothetical protein JCM14076_16500 [Methylosoma difficile]